MIDLAILGLLKDQDLHGYELRKRLGELPGGRGGVSFGSLYPALNRLERDGHLKAVEANELAERPVPSSGSLAGELAAFRSRHTRPTPRGRAKKVYGITPVGETYLVDLLIDPQPTDDRTFALKVAFCRYLEPSRRLALFERRRAELVSRQAEREHRDGKERLRDRYLRSLTERDLHNLTTDLAWLDRLIEGERAALSNPAMAGGSPEETHE